jgi:hypothetical protein
MYLLIWIRSSKKTRNQTIPGFYIFVVHIVLFIYSEQIIYCMLIQTAIRLPGVILQNDGRYNRLLRFPVNRQGM